MALPVPAADAWGNCTEGSFRTPQDVEREEYLRRLEAKLQRLRGVGGRVVGEDKCAADIYKGLSQLNSHVQQEHGSRVAVAAARSDGIVTSEEIEDAPLLPDTPDSPAMPPISSRRIGVPHSPSPREIEQRFCCQAFIDWLSSCFS